MKINFIEKNPNRVVSSTIRTSFGVLIKGAFFLLLFSGCQRVSPSLEYRQPHVQSRAHNPFPKISDEEGSLDWVKEYRIGVAFAKEGDYYQAITNFKRALILLPDTYALRRHELSYAIVLSYYLADLYPQAIQAFEKSDLTTIDPSFVAYRNLLLILFDCYEKCHKKEQAETILKLLEGKEDTAALKLTSAFYEGDLKKIQSLSQESKPYIQKLAKEYEKKQKSPQIAKTLNALLPGAGYLYLGQQKSAITSFLVNGLFTAALVELFIHRQIAGGVIVSTLEAGWYFGGIYGASMAAERQNQRLTRAFGEKVMQQEGLFPILRLNYEF